MTTHATPPILHGGQDVPAPGTGALRPSDHVPAAGGRPGGAAAAGTEPRTNHTERAGQSYPRPDRDRSQRWLSLDGRWSFSSVDGDSSIVVPYAWDSAASGVARTWLEEAVYSRHVVVPAAWAGQRVFLCFGAVHHQAHVFLDDVEVGSHTGGYTPFEIDLSPHLSGSSTTDGARLRVQVSAPADKRTIPHGKQRSIPRDDYDGVSFTPTSGIWQSVWLEARGRTYLDHLAVRGDSLTGFALDGTLAGDAPADAAVLVTVTAGSRHHESVTLTADPSGRVRGHLDLDDPRPWSPDDPHLYTLTCTVLPDGAAPAEASDPPHHLFPDAIGRRVPDEPSAVIPAGAPTAAGTASDQVAYTAGLRRIEAVGEELYLNGQRLYVRGVLDQGYWPETGMTAPDEQALVRDLELAARCGYNLVRKHIKLEDPRWLHHADRLGMLVWAEPPAPSRYTAASAAAFEDQLPPMLTRDGNHPSIIIWGLWNEEWGLDWDIPGSPERAAAAAHAYDTMRALDDTRLVVDNSGWAHVKTDLVDWHYYDEDPAAWATNVEALATGASEQFPVRLAADFVVDKGLYAHTDHPRTGLPVLNSEYGAGFTSLERAWHLRWQTQELRRHDRFAGYVYTELCDVEHEMAGIFDADRRPKDTGGHTPADANATTTLVLDLVPLAAGADVPPAPDGLELGVRVSHHGHQPIEGRVRASWAAAGAPVDRSATTSPWQSLPVTAEPFRLSDAVTVSVPAPPGTGGVGRLHVWLVDDADRPIARTFVDAAPVEPPNRRGATRPTAPPDRLQQLG